MDLREELQKMINLYYDSLELGNGRTNDNVPVRYDTTVHKHLDWVSLSYEKKLISQFEDSANLNLYVIELFYVQRTDEVFKNIPETTLELLRNKKLKLLMYFPTEGFKLDLYDNWFIRMHEIFVEYGLADTDKYFIYNNMTIEEQYEKLVANNQLPCRFNKVFGFSFFQLEHLYRLKAQTSPVSTERMMNKDVNFYCQNAKMRAHRLLLVSELSRRNLLSNSFTSMLKENPHFTCAETTLEHVTNVLLKLFSTNNDIPQEAKDYLVEFSNNWQPMTLDDINNIDLEAHVVTEYYERSYFSLVSETGMDHYLRLSEKTFKPLANYHPYIIIGCHGTLRYLKSLGYETFPEFFDESYDEETNIPKRLLMVVDEVEKFCKLSKEEKDRRLLTVKDKLYHNHNLFFNVLPEINRERLRQIFREMA